ncbi:MAG: hypothetical protein AAF990_12920 [Bacteroidota bacterium]
MQRSTLLFLLLLLPISCLFAQETDLFAFNELRLQTNKKAMTILGSWAIGNMALGAVLMNKREGTEKYFHQMNLGWNAVNLGLASLAYLAAAKSDPATFDMIGSLKEQQKIQKILLFNAGLDIGYMLGGLYLTERSKNTENRPERLKGFGRSIILQGAFLFVFDLGFYFAHQSNDKLLHKLIGSLSMNGDGIGFNWVF